MGMKPFEVDRLTPIQFSGLWALWKQMNLKSESPTLAAPTAEQALEAAEAERLYGGAAA
jgi:hypothetical protein